MAENGPLPVTDPAATSATSDENAKTYCFKIVGQHDMREAGESQWVPWKALFTTRLLSGLIFIALLLATILKFSRISKALTFATLGPVAAFATLGFSATTFLALALCTCLQGTGAQAARKAGLSSAAVFLHFITAALSVYLFPYFSRLSIGSGFHPQFLVLLLPLVLYLLDALVMRSRIRFRYRYALFFTLATCVYNAIYALVYFFGVCLDCARGSAIVTSLVGTIALASLAGLIAVWVTRRACWCSDKS